MKTDVLLTGLLSSLLGASFALAAPAVAREAGGRLAAPAAASNTVVPLQLRLTGPSSTSVNGLRTMTFKLYNTPTGGSALWSEPRTAENAVQVTDGVASVLLGSVASLPQSVVAGNPTLYLGVTVDIETEMQPRIQLGSAPIALTIPDGSVTTSKLVSGTVVARYSLPWFDSETPFTTSSVTYVDCGNTWGGGFAGGFPAVAPGAARRVRIAVGSGDSYSGGTYLRVIKRGTNELVQEIPIPARFSWGDYQNWTYGDYLYDLPNVHLEFQVRVSDPIKTMYLYRVIVFAEDYIP